MRFRLATSGAGGQSLQNGIGSIFQAMAMAPLLRAQAAEESQTADMRRQLMQSQIGAHESTMGKNIAEAAIKQREAEQLAGRPDVLALMGASRAGMDVPTFRAGISERTHGAPMEGPPLLSPAIPGVGPSGRTAQFDDAITTLYGPAMATPADKTNWDQLANARGGYQQQDVLDQVLAGRTNPGRAGQAVAASKGTKQVENITDSGTGFNIHTGAGVTLDPGLQVLFGNKVKATVNKDNAAAGASGALAGQRKAQTDRIKGGYSKTVDLVDEDTGEVTIVRTPTGGEPVRVGVRPPKAGGGTEATNAKARNAVVAAVERDLKGATDAEIQEEVDRRMARRAPAPKGGAPAPSQAAPKIDMTAAAQIKADAKAGKITREQAIVKLKALGFQ